jgi:hypothetical protein
MRSCGEHKVLTRAVPGPGSRCADRTERGLRIPTASAFMSLSLAVHERIALVDHVFQLVHAHAHVARIGEQRVDPLPHYAQPLAARKWRSGSRATRYLTWLKICL